MCFLCLLRFLCYLDYDRRMDQDELIRTGTAARILGTSRQHIVDLCNQGALTCVRAPKQRRLRRSDVEAFATGTEAHRPLNRDQRQSLWLHSAVAGRVVADPLRTLQRARTNLERLRQVHTHRGSARWLDRWESQLQAGPDAVLETLTSSAPEAVELRQNSPFAGVLSDLERRQILAAFRQRDQGPPG
jgi:excisionase family DNA binding protein